MNEIVKSILCVNYLKLYYVFISMEMNQFLSRHTEEAAMIQFLNQYNKHNETEKRSIYIHGPPGCGKSILIPIIA